MRRSRVRFSYPAPICMRRFVPLWARFAPLAEPMHRSPHLRAQVVSGCFGSPLLNWVCPVSVSGTGDTLILPHRFCRTSDLAMPSWGMRLQQLDTFATRHHGLINQDAAATLGVGRSSWYRAIESGYLEQLFPGVARLYGTPSTLHQRALAAVWAAGPGAMASHRTAAALWGVERPATDPIDVIITSRTRTPRRDGIIIHRPRDLVDLRPFMRNRVPTCSPTRMLVDLGAVDEPSVDAAMIEILVSKAVSPLAVRAALTRHSRRGRSGLTALRRSLARWLGDELPPDSLLESRMSMLIAEYGLPPVEFHALVAGYEVDFLVIGTPIILECDGWASHGLDRDQFEFDRIRNADLVAEGFIPVHFTWAALNGSPQKVASRIRAALARWS